MPKCPKKGSPKQNPLERGHGEIQIQYKKREAPPVFSDRLTFFRIIVFMLKWESPFLLFRVTCGLDKLSLLDLTLGG